LLGYRHYSDDVVQSFVAKASDNGIDVFRIFDALNDTRNLQTSIEAVKQTGKHAQGALSYTLSPVHSSETFVAMARELEAMGCDSIVVKDMAGLLTPYAAAELFQALSQAVSLPLHLHSHSTSGLAEMCFLKAIENGCSGIDTAISALSGGTSHPATESMVAAFKGTDYDTGLDLAQLQTIGFYFNDVRKKYHQFESDYTGVDTRVQLNQVPGGMISNLANQLREQGALKRINEVLEEIPRVREDLGFPPLVTPTSQIVGTQAVLNVLTGSRYQSITNEVKYYLQGRYGRAPGEVNALVRQKAIGNEEVITVRPADLLPAEMARLTREIGELAHSEEDTLTYAMFPEVGREFLQQRAEGSLKPEPLEPLPNEESTIAGTPTEFNVTLHGDTYNIKITGSGHKNQARRPLFVTVDGVPEEVGIEVLEELYIEQASNGTTKTIPSQSERPRASRQGHVTTSMPATVVEVLVEEGATVEAGASLLITEAMKMESEIQAPIAGTVKAVHVKKGDRVNPDEALIEIE
ncbi:MAG: pyruvate carboxylase subunit B, partial [Gammaproteobacteria bacterium]|nr:pyruvate carboxylase subunit B [Gammaproteobacteria bacterium]